MFLPKARLKEKNHLKAGDWTCVKKVSSFEEDYSETTEQLYYSIIILEKDVPLGVK